MVQDMDKWRILVNTVMNLRLLYNVEKFLAAERLAASQEELISTELVR
jgi:hypothetical protein